MTTYAHTFTFSWKCGRGICCDLGHALSTAPGMRNANISTHLVLILY